MSRGLSDSPCPSRSSVITRWPRFARSRASGSCMRLGNSRPGSSTTLRGPLRGPRTRGAGRRGRRWASGAEESSRGACGAKLGRNRPTCGLFERSSTRCGKFFKIRATGPMMTSWRRSGRPDPPSQRDVAARSMAAAAALLGRAPRTRGCGRERGGVRDPLGALPPAAAVVLPSRAGLSPRGRGGRAAGVRQRISRDGAGRRARAARAPWLYRIARNQCFSIAAHPQARGPARRRRAVARRPLRGGRGSRGTARHAARPGGAAGRPARGAGAGGASRQLPRAGRRDLGLRPQQGEGAGVPGTRIADEEPRGPRAAMRRGPEPAERAARRLAAPHACCAATWRSARPAACSAPR